MGIVIFTNELFKNEYYFSLEKGRRTEEKRSEKFSFFKTNEKK